MFFDSTRSSNKAIDKQIILVSSELGEFLSPAKIRQVNIDLKKKLHYPGCQQLCCL
jgi:hypothetical protein